MSIKSFFTQRKIRKFEKINSELEKELEDRLVSEEQERHNKFLMDIKTTKDSLKDYDLKKSTPFFQRISNLFSKGSKFLIQMHLENGHIASFVIKAKERFIWKKGVYIIDEKSKRYNKNAKLYELHYHERCSLPFAIEFSHIDAKNQLKQIESVDLALNPDTLEIYIHSQFVQKVMQGADMEKLFGFFKIALIIIIVIGIIDTLLLIKAIS